MSSVPYKFTTTASTNLQSVRAGQTANITGISVANVATAIYIKFYWTNSVTVGTTVPGMTIGVAASAKVLQMLPAITDNSQLWVAVTGAAGDSDTTNAASGAVVTIFVE